MAQDEIILAVRSTETAFLADGATAWSAPFPDFKPWFGPRNWLEGDTAFRQLIPYVVVRHPDGRILAYERSKAGGEGRLHGKLSIGVGGHVDLDDRCGGDENFVDVQLTLEAGAFREIYEELGLIFQERFKTLGFIKVSETNVDLVHLGVLMEAQLREEELAVLRFEDALANVRFMTKEEIQSTSLELESWSKLALDLL